jgi:hypothetical protein
MADIIQTNCKECQEAGKAIKFPSLLIWIEMEKYSPFGEPVFTIRKVPTMEKYRIFAAEQEGASRSLPPQEMFRLWVKNLKYSSHRWCVEKSVHRALSTPCHIQLELDCTKLWCGLESALKPEELHYQPTTEEIFTELERQTDQEIEIPPEVNQPGLPLVFPLTDVEHEEEREAKLYAVPFVEDLEALAIVPARPSPGKRKQPMKKDKGKKAVEVEEISYDTEEIWWETFQSTGGMNFNDPIIQEKMTSITRKIPEKIKQTERQTRQETATMKNILSSSVRPGMKEAMEKDKVQK